MKHRFQALQSCKGLAALFIVCGHFFGGISTFTVAYILMCDFFFICSGMTTGQSIKNYESEKTYLEHMFRSKIKKVWTPYIIICAIWMALIYIGRGFNKLNLTDVIFVTMLLQCMGFMSNGQEILNASPIGISWYLSVDFWGGTIYFYIIYLLRKRKDISVLIEIIVALSCANILVNTSPSYMDVHYAKLMVGNLTLTYALIRSLLGYSIGLLISEMYTCIVNVKKTDIQNKYVVSFTIIEILCFAAFWGLYGNINYYRINEFAFPILGAIIVFVMCMERGYICKILKRKCFTFLGRYSLYFYLTHMVAKELIARSLSLRAYYFPLYLILMIALSIMLSGCCKYIVNFHNN